MTHGKRASDPVLSECGALKTWGVMEAFRGAFRRSAHDPLTQVRRTWGFAGVP